MHIRINAYQVQSNHAQKDLGAGCEYDDMILLTNRPGKSDRCAALDYICGENGEYPNHPKCKEFCDENLI
jgi:hypothetical protein